MEMQPVWCIRMVMALLMGNVLGGDTGEASSIRVGLPESSVCVTVTALELRYTRRGMDKQF